MEAKIIANMMNVNDLINSYFALSPSGESAQTTYGPNHALHLNEHTSHLLHIPKSYNRLLFFHKLNRLRSLLGY